VYQPSLVRLPIQNHRHEDQRPGTPRCKASSRSKEGIQNGVRWIHQSSHKHPQRFGLNDGAHSPGKNDRGAAPDQGQQTAWQLRILQILVEVLAECQSLQAAWQQHILQVLVEINVEGQALQTAWELCILRLLVEAAAEGQGLQAARELHILQAAVELKAEGQALQTGGELNILQVLVEAFAEVQSLQTAWALYVLQGIGRQKSSFCGPLGSVTFFKL
jgi:hypothetical protein